MKSKEQLKSKFKDCLKSREKARSVINELSDMQDKDEHQNSVLNFAKSRFATSTAWMNALEFAMKD